MPLGAFIADKKIMDCFTDNPVLGHITTFGGHPVCCAAGMAAMQELLNENYIKEIPVKVELLKNLLIHPAIKSTSSFGLWMAIQFSSSEICKTVIDNCIEQGVFTDWFLFAPDCLRISPPLTINLHQLEMAAKTILKSLSKKS